MAIAMNRDPHRGMVPADDSRARGMFSARGPYPAEYPEYGIHNVIVNLEKTLFSSRGQIAPPSRLAIFNAYLRFAPTQTGSVENHAPPDGFSGAAAGSNRCCRAIEVLQHRP